MLATCDLFSVFASKLRKMRIQVVGSHFDTAARTFRRPKKTTEWPRRDKEKKGKGQGMTATKRVSNFVPSWEFHSAKDFHHVVSNWDRLNDEQDGSPLTDSINVSLLLKHFGTGREQVALCRDGREVVAATILTGGLRRQTWQPGNQPLGIWLQMPGYESASIVKSLMSTGALMLSVMQLDPDIVSRPEVSATLETVDYIRTARIPIDSSFDEYWARRAKLASNLRNRRKKLGAITTRLEIVSSPESIGAAVDDYGRLESRGWKGAENSAVTPENAQGRYYREWFEQIARYGRARVYRYFYDDRLVASDLCVLRNGIFVVAKTCFDEEERKTSPSQLMREEMFRQVFDEEMVQIEFYGRAMEWHEAWCDDFRAMYHINAFRWPWVRKGRELLRRRKAPSFESVRAAATISMGQLQRTD